MSDLATSFYFSWDGLAFLIFPTMGAYLTEKIGFPHVMDIIGLILLLNGALFIVPSIIDLKKSSQE